ncbi:6-phospho-3-hexuloisomerase [Streptomyces sp. NPDC059740]|uniref:6-phospho-3-hexuloisomerase n=1 Tax=Streptomyces sp. NPDC059740 TaxID=3346926 RepID=UPI003660CF93
MVEQDRPLGSEVSPPDTTIGVDGPHASARRLILRELDALLAHIDEDACTRLVAELREAARIFVTGAGRSGLSAAAFAMRLMHLGLDAHVAGDVTAPAIGSDDLLLVCSGSGETPTAVLMAENAARHGARTVAVTANAGSRLSRRADLVVHLAEYSQDHEPGGSRQFVGTLFEQGALLFLDSVVLVYQLEYQVDPQEMLARHTNLE